MADPAALAIQLYFIAKLDVEDKGGRVFDPITWPTRLLYEPCANSFKNSAHGILSEEEGLNIGSSELTWVLDPIDGN